jgi:Tfp pilus assembly PilM family ATPase
LSVAYFRRPRLLGLDINPAGIYVTELQKNWRTWQLLRVIHMSIDEEIMRDGEICHWPAWQRLLTKLVMDHQLQGRAVAAELPYHVVRMTQINVPEGLSEAAISLEMKAALRHAYLAKDDVLQYDYVEVKSNRLGYHHVVVAAARKAYIEKYSASIREAGLVLSVMDVNAYALRRVAFFAAGIRITPTALHAVLVMREQSIWQLVWLAEKIIFCEQWTRTADVDWYAELRDQFAVCLEKKTLQDVQLLLVMGASEQDKQALLRLPVQQVQFVRPFPSANMGVDFAVSCGLALRERPAW